MIARRLAGIEIAVVETRASEREVAALGIDLALRDFRPQRRKETRTQLVSLPYLGTILERKETRTQLVSLP